MDPSKASYPRANALRWKAQRRLAFRKGFMSQTSVFSLLFTWALKRFKALIPDTASFSTFDSDESSPEVDQELLRGSWHLKNSSNGHWSYPNLSKQACFWLLFFDFLKVFHWLSCISQTQTTLKSWGKAHSAAQFAQPLSGLSQGPVGADFVCSFNGYTNH